jgi:hypothetical protein
MLPDWKNFAFWESFVPNLPVCGIHTYFYVAKFTIWVNLEGHAMEDVGIFYAVSYILQSFVRFYGHLIHFSVIRYIFAVLVCCMYQKIDNPDSRLKDWLQFLIYKK